MEPVMFSAHLDRVEGGVGVKPVLVDGPCQSDGSTILGADDAAGLAAIVEACRVSQRPTRHTRRWSSCSPSVKRSAFGRIPSRRERSQSKVGLRPGCRRAGGHHHRAWAPTHYIIEAQFFGRAAHAGIEPERGSTRSRSQRRR